MKSKLSQKSEKIDIAKLAFKDIRLEPIITFSAVTIFYLTLEISVDISNKQTTEEGGTNEK